MTIDRPQQAAALLALTALGFSLWAGEVKTMLPPETARLKPGPGADLASAQCLLCHSADYISTQPPLSSNAWRAAVLKMRDKYGAPIPEDKVTDLARYLSASYGNGK